jgi:Spy/CpxP family protein refolding chaperone
MTRMKRALSIATGVAILAALASPSFASPGDGDGAGGRAGRAGARAERRAARFERLGRRAHGRAKAMRMLEALNLTDAQKADLKAARESASAVREDLHAKIRAIRQEAREGERTKESREAARAKVKAAVASAREAVAPSATRFVASLTAEQKQALVDRAAKRGKTFDESKLVKAIERLLISGRR